MRSLQIVAFDESVTKATLIVTMAINANMLIGMRSMNIGKVTYSNMNSHLHVLCASILYSSTVCLLPSGDGIYGVPRILVTPLHDWKKWQ